MLTALLTVLLFCIMIIPHEFGHFVMAKLLGVQVNEFSIGMGPKLLQKTKGETKYSLRAFPIGGYCAMEGEDGDDGSDEVESNPRAFSNKSAMRKIAILLAGAIMNILIANLLIIIAVTAMGSPVNTLKNVTKDGPAYVAGVRANDKIISVNNIEVSSWNDTVTELNKTKPGSSIDLTVQRDGKTKEYTVVPEVEGNKMIVGIEADLSHSIIINAPLGIRATWNLNKDFYAGIKKMVTGGVKKDDLGGPVRIVSLVNDTRQYGFTSFLFLAAIISINLAFLNLLPFPALDGGRILFVLIRKVTGNAVSDKVESYFHLAGMGLLLLLFVLITWNDVVSLLH